MTEPRDTYSPERRTALLFTGTGADGAYHAGALRAIQEAGVKVDIVGGRGVGAIAAVLAAVDGSAQLWESGGFWHSPSIPLLYRWRWPFRLLRRLALGLVGVFAIPAAVILLGLIVYPIALVLGMAGLDAGARFVQSFLDTLTMAFLPAALPTWLPRLAALLADLRASTWEDAHGVVINAQGLTLWKAWIAIDTTAPQTGRHVALDPFDEVIVVREWDRIPDHDMLARVIAFALSTDDGA